MKDFFHFFLALFGAVVLFSCDASRTEDGDLLFGLNEIPVADDPSDPVEDNYLLSKYVFTDTDGKKVTATYNYNGTRLISSKLVDEDEKTTSDFTLTYNGSELSKIKIVEDDGFDVTTTEFTLTYEGAKPVSAKGTSQAEGEEKTVFENEFKYNAGGKVNKIETKFFTESEPQMGITLISEIQYAGNNMSSWKLTTKQPIIPDIVINTLFSGFDDKKNPFGTLPEAFTIATAHFTTSANGILGLSANNMKKMSVMGIEGNFTYEYDGNGYPTVAKTEQGNIVYEYKR